jgi:hypothetical protein
MIAPVDPVVEQAEAGRRVIQFLARSQDMGDPACLVGGMLDEMRTTHRTLQQDVIRAMVMFLLDYKAFDHDLRNEAAVELCEGLAGVIEESPLPRL